MEHEEITGKIIAASIKIHRALGPGLLEETYKQCLRHLLIKDGLRTEAEVPVHLFFDGLEIGIGYRLDLLVENSVIVELKAVDYVTEIHKAQVLTYLKLSKKRVALLMNFNARTLKDGLTRFIH